MKIGLRLFTTEKALQFLRSFDLPTLFIEELGWDRHVATLEVTVDRQRYALRGVAHKRGMVAFVCSPGNDGRIPPGPLRQAIERKVAEVAREHLVIFHDAGRTEAVWQWVRRAPGQPSVPREELYHRDLPGDWLLQLLRRLAFSFDEEDRLTLTDVNARVQRAFNVERVTKRFYERYKGEHEAFVATLGGLPDIAAQRWYTSVMLNRLMFTYFIQKKGFLDSDDDYLRQNLARSKRRGRDRFYRDFLLPLYFNGLARPRASRPVEMCALLGEIPYLNGGLFQPHPLERQYGNNIVIADEAFDRPLDFFDQYRWHLDDHPRHDDSEINPEVLGYIFEQYINQKQMGAYYTKEDITGYIARSSIVPALFDKAQQHCPQAFAANSPLWLRLAAEPERYIRDDMGKGLELALPSQIACGIDDPGQRGAWNGWAPTEYALPNEIWRDVVTRRQRYDALLARLRRSTAQTINALIADNLDLTAFAHDTIATTDDPELLLAFWRSIDQLTVLDPTSGSGAFLFAALNVLTPLYELCLERMAVLVGDHERASQPGTATIAALRDVLTRVGQHPNRDYFVLKSIIVNNLYGVDIMEEAVEICKLRLFLKLAAQIEHDPSQPNLGAEPLPDVDFNIFTGNALVGYATYNEVRRAVNETVRGQARIPFDDPMHRIESRVRSVDAQFVQFRQAQVASMQSDDTPAKPALQHALSDLEHELNCYLTIEYGVDATDTVRFEAWQASHQPFHWFVNFYRVLQQRGGFDVVIGNPPYVGYPKVRSLYTVRGYETEPCANLYAFAVERSLDLLRPDGRYGMIVPIASLSTTGMAEIQALYEGYRQWHSHWAVRPGKLFVGVDMNLTITLLQKTREVNQSYTTGYRRWSNGSTSDRQQLFTTLAYTANPHLTNHSNAYPKLGSPLECDLLARMLRHGRKLRHYTDPTGKAIYYHSGGRYWRKALPTKLSSHYKPVQVPEQLVPVVFALLNSQLFYWYWIANSNCMDVVSREVLDLPVFALEQADVGAFSELMERLLTAYYANNTTRVRRGEHISVDEINFDVRQAKPIIDEIDTLLAYHYDFADEELDFVLNYDIKYRTGGEA